MWTGPRARRLMLALSSLLACSSTEPSPEPTPSAAKVETAKSEAPTKPEPAPTKPEPAPPSFDQRSPRVGDPAPPISLATLAGERVSLPQADSSRPTVLIFGSFTCPPFRMKTPGFEQLARHWRDKADFYIVFSREAHASAEGAERLGQAADQLIAQDADGDNAVTLAEYTGPKEMFEPFDLDDDGVVRSYELLASRRLPEFEAIEQPVEAAERALLASRFRRAVPGEIPVLLDEMDNRTAQAYGRAPNSLFVIAANGTISHKYFWASTREANAALADLLGEEPAKLDQRPIDWTVIEAELAAAGDAPLLLQFTALGCSACARMTSETLAEASVKARLASYHHVTLGLERDEVWALFQAIDLSATPAFVIVDPAKRTLVDKTQGFSAGDEFLRFLPER